MLDRPARDRPIAMSLPHGGAHLITTSTTPPTAAAQRLVTYTTAGPRASRTSLLPAPISAGPVGQDASLDQPLQTAILPRPLEQVRS